MAADEVAADDVGEDADEDLLGLFDRFDGLQLVQKIYEQINGK